MKKKKLKFKLPKKLKKLTWVFLVLFAVGGIYLTISTANAGAKLAYLENLEADILEENQRLKGELIGLSSLKSLEDKAKELGFDRPNKLIYLTEDDPVAKIP